MKDQFERNIDYMRISLTDRCNLRCRFCMPAEPVSCFEQEEILTEQELLGIISAAVKLGISTFRLTGGEPLLRDDLEWLITSMKCIPGVKNVNLTTNGILLEKKLSGLIRAGLSGVNISLCSTDPAEYRQITGRDQCHTVLSAISAAAEGGLQTKVNCVPMPGENLSHIGDIAGLAQDMYVDVRFIEMMPLGKGADFKGLAGREIRNMLRAWYGPAELVRESCGKGPAVYYRFPGLKGKIGFISAGSCNFCGSCNRVRLMADGFLKLCLQFEEGINLRNIVRSGCTQDELIYQMEKIIRQKPKGHKFCGGSTEGLKNERRCMAQIGG